MPIFALKRWLSLLALLWFSCVAYAWTPGLTEAAQAVAAGRASTAQELMVFINNREINLLAQEGRLSERIYAVCQDEFFQLNNRLVNQAADRAGFGASISDAKLNPGTDTDVNVLSKSGKPLRLEDIQKIEGQYQAAVRDHFLGKDPTLDIPKSRIDTNTDFMPHPQHTPPGEFESISKHINANGGTAYTDPRAASAQAKLGSKAPLTLDEASSFGNTMKDMASAKIRKADALRKEAAGLRGADPGKAQVLEAQAAQYEYQAAKYHDRLNQLDQHLREQFKLPERSGAGAVDDAAKKIGSIGRNPYSRSELGTIRSLHENALQRSTDDLIDTLLSGARKDPSRLADVRRIVTEQARSLPMSRAGQAMERLQNTVQKIEAASKWTAFKSAARDLSGVKQLTKVSVVMTAGGALLMGHEGVKAALKDVKATDTVWDFFKNVFVHAGWEGTGIGPAFDRAQAEELAKYMQQFEAGADPSMAQHVTFTILKSGVYLGQDVLIGVLYLPSSIWEYFTQEQELEAYAAFQNDLARVMHQMVLDRQAFEQIMNRFRKLGLDEKDTLAFMNCLCRECGGMLGGLYNPGFKGEYGHGPCQCNGPLTIWKTPLPVQNTKVQYACFNAISKMHYDQAQDIFDKWRQQAQQANAESVADDLKAIEADIRAGEVERDEVVAHDMADRISAIKDLLMPQALDNLRSYVGPHLANHAARKIETGEIDRSIDDVDRVLKKIGTRHPQEEVNLKSTQTQYQQWAKAWAEVKEKQFPAMDQRLQKGQVHTARGELEVLEYRMMKEQPRKLPYANKDPQFVALKERVLAQQKAYQDGLLAAHTETSARQRAKDPRAAISILQKVLSSWEHLPDTAQGLQRQIAYNQGELDKALRHAALGQQDEKLGAPGALASAIEHYKASLALQHDAALQAHLARLQDQLAAQQQRLAQAKQLRDQGAALQQQNQIPQAIDKYRESLALVPDPTLETHIHALQTQWEVQKVQQAQQQRLAQAKQLRDEGAALQQSNKVAEAIEKYRQSLALVPDPALEAHIRNLKSDWSAQQAQQQRLAQAKQLRDQGAALQQQNQIPQAIDKYRESLALVPDPTLEAHIHALQTQWEAQKAQQAQQQRLAQAKQLREEGAALQQRNQVAEAIQKYQQSLALVPDAALEAHIRNLQAALVTKPTPAPAPAPVPTPTHAPEAVTAAPAVPAPTAQGRVLFDNGNISGVSNQPTQHTQVRFASQVTVTRINNYHWNNGQGTPQAGSVGLRDASGRLYGPWPAQGSIGQGNVRNANWSAYPNVTLPAGVYTVVDSDPSTWAQNSGSKGAGHTRIEGIGSPGAGVISGVGTTSHTPTPQPVTPPRPVAGQLDGRYGGKFSGDGEGTLSLTLHGTSVQGTLKGQVEGDPVSAAVSGSVDSRGQLRLTMKGTVRWSLSGGSASGETPFTGELTGSVQGSRASGRWMARSVDGDEQRSGSWNCSR